MGLIFFKKKESLTLGDLFKMLAKDKKKVKEIVKRATDSKYVDHNLTKRNEKGL